MLRVQNYYCSAYTGTGAANVYTKRDIENSRLCEQGTADVLNTSY